MTAGQLELPLFTEAKATHSALLSWHPVGKPDGTYTTTCDCGDEPVITHSWRDQEAAFLEHCKRGNP